jgi:hypothetical protein
MDPMGSVPFGFHSHFVFLLAEEDLVKLRYLYFQCFSDLRLIDLKDGPFVIFG